MTDRRRLQALIVAFLREHGIVLGHGDQGTPHIVVVRAGARPSPSGALPTGCPTEGCGLKHTRINLADLAMYLEGR